MFAGRDAVYERVVPQQGITHCVVGSSGTLDRGRLKPNSALTAEGYDQDQVVLVAEIMGADLRFTAFSRTGDIVDTGVINRR